MILLGFIKVKNFLKADKCCLDREVHRIFFNNFSLKSVSYNHCYFTRGSSRSTSYKNNLRTSCENFDLNSLDEMVGPYF